MPLDRLDTRIKLTPKVLNSIARIDEVKGRWHGGLRLSPQILGRLRSSVIITSSGASARIEGSKMNDEEVARLIRGLKSRPPKNRDEQEVAGYADLLGRIFDHFTTLKLSENTILQFHEILLHYSEKDTVHRGIYKRANNTVVMKTEDGKEVVLFEPSPPYLVKSEMDWAIDWTKQRMVESDIHPLIVIGNFIFEFLATHPFIDGNGRLSRALTNLLLLKAGYAFVPYVSLDEIIEAHRTDYYLALRASQKNHKTDHEDLTPWLEFFLEMLVIQADLAKKLLENEQPEKLLSGKQSLVFQQFVDAGTQLSVSDLSGRLGGTIPLPTIKQALSRLVTLLLLERIGQGRGTRYQRPHPLRMDETI